MGLFDWLRLNLDPHAAEMAEAERAVAGVHRDRVVDAALRAALFSDPTRMRWTPRTGGDPSQLPPIARAILSAYVVEAPDTGLVVGGDCVRPDGAQSWIVGVEETFHTTIRVAGDETTFECEDGFEPDRAGATLGHFLLMRGHAVGAFDVRKLVEAL